MEKQEKKLALNHESIFAYLMNRKTQVLDGYEDALKLALDLKKLEYVISHIKELIKSDVIDEIIDPVEIEGYVIKQTTGGRYDYSGNSKVVALESELKQIKDAMKKASKGFVIMDENGERYPEAIFKPSRTGYRIEKLH